MRFDKNYTLTLIRIQLIIEYLIFGSMMTFNYILLGLLAFFTSTSVFGSYKLLNSFSNWINNKNENYDDITQENKILLSLINRIWSVDKNLSIIVFVLLSMSLLMMKENIIEITIVYSITWMIYVLNSIYDSLLSRIISNYRIYNSK